MFVTKNHSGILKIQDLKMMNSTECQIPYVFKAFHRGLTNTRTQNFCENLLDRATPGGLGVRDPCFEKNSSKKKTGFRGGTCSGPFRKSFDLLTKAHFPTF